MSCASVAAWNWGFFGGTIFIGVFGWFMRNFIDPTPRGFFCNDQSIRLPYRENTIDFAWVLIVGNALHLLSSVGIELFLHQKSRRNNLMMHGKVYDNDIDAESTSTCVSSFAMFGRRVPRFAIRIVKHFLLLQLGFAINLWLVNVVKLTLGSLRPHFIDVCRPLLLPDGNELSEFCNLSTSWSYVENYRCSGNFTDKETTDARMSFYSGHSSTAFYFATFIVLYWQVRFGRHEVRLGGFMRQRHRSSSNASGSAASLALLPSAAFLFAGYAVLESVASVVALSRIYDHKHHPVDVAVGTLVGIALAFVTIFQFWHEFADDHGAGACATAQTHRRRASTEENLPTTNTTTADLDANNGLNRGGIGVMVGCCTDGRRGSNNEAGGRDAAASGVVVDTNDRRTNSF